MKNEEYGIILVDEDNNWIGEADYTRWNELPWYKQLWGNIFYYYKLKYTDVKGFEVKAGIQNQTERINKMVDRSNKKNQSMITDTPLIWTAFKDLNYIQLNEARDQCINNLKKIDNEINKRIKAVTVNTEGGGNYSKHDTPNPRPKTPERPKFPQDRKE